VRVDPALHIWPCEPSDSKRNRERKIVFDLEDGWMDNPSFWRRNVIASFFACFCDQIKDNFVISAILVYECPTRIELPCSKHTAINKMKENL
jgi:hypothetical protein